MLIFVDKFDTCAAVSNCNLNIIILQHGVLIEIEKKTQFINYGIGSSRNL